MKSPAFRIALILAMSATSAFPQDENKGMSPTVS
jgi:hypothetical protein